MERENPIAAIALQFVVFSLLSLGGVSAVLPDMHRFLVETTGLLTESEFVELYTLGRAAPGPNVLFVTLFGWRIGGPLGALAITAGMCLPPALLAFAFVRLWGRMPFPTWRRTIEGALAWLAGGFMLAGGYVLTLSADHSTMAFAITAVATAISFATRISPLWTLAAAAGMGIAGWV